MSTSRRRLRVLVRDVGTELRGHDVLLYAAGVTFYGAIAAVPLVVVTVYLAGVLVGEGTVRHLGTLLAEQLPMNLGAERAARSLVEATTRLPVTTALVALLPASLYSEGLVRAFDRLSVAADSRLSRGLRGRLKSLPLYALAPVLLLAILIATTWINGAVGSGTGGRLLGVYLAFLTGWFSFTVLLVGAYRFLSPERLNVRAVLWGAASTGSMLAGMVLGFVLFLQIHIDIGAAYGGFATVAAVAVVGGWAYLLHVILLAGYLLTRRLAARAGHPTGPDVLDVPMPEAVTAG